MLDDLRRLAAKPQRHTRPLHEFYRLVRPIAGRPGYTTSEQALCAALESGPLPLQRAAEAAGCDVYCLDAARLIREGAVQVCGLTPTDMMHLVGDYIGHCPEAAALGAKVVAHNLGNSVEALCRAVYGEVERKLYVGVVRALLENQTPAYLKTGLPAEVEAFIEQSYRLAKSRKPAEFVAAGFTTRFALVGVGAPVGIFLPGWPGCWAHAR